MGESKSTLLVNVLVLRVVARYLLLLDSLKCLFRFYSAVFLSSSRCACRSIVSNSSSIQQTNNMWWKLKFVILAVCLGLSVRIAKLLNEYPVTEGVIVVSFVDLFMRLKYIHPSPCLNYFFKMQLFIGIISSKKPINVLLVISCCSTFSIATRLAEIQFDPSTTCTQFATANTLTNGPSSTPENVKTLDVPMTHTNVSIWNLCCSSLFFSPRDRAP